MKLLWVKKDPLGRPLHPWEEITLDQLSPEARKLIQKMARVSARDFFDEVKEEWTEAWSIDIGRRVSKAVEARYSGAPADAATVAQATADEAPAAPPAVIPAQRTDKAPPCSGPHLCGGQRVGWCKESCRLCMASMGRLPVACALGCEPKGFGL